MLTPTLNCKLNIFKLPPLLAYLEKLTHAQQKGEGVYKREKD